MGKQLVADNRGVSPVVAKALAIGLVALYLAGMSTALLGGVVPAYETRAGAEVGERTIATAANEIERTPPAVEGDVETRTTIMLPESIANSNYRLVLSNETDRLVLEHPDAAIETATSLSLPAGTTVENGTVLGGEVTITVRGPADNRTVAIEETDS